MRWWWQPRRRDEEAVRRAKHVADNADETFKLLALTVVRLHKTTKELEKALEELNHAE